MKDDTIGASTVDAVGDGHGVKQVGWFGHPRPLARLFSTEMWERFGFYGLRALLTLYLTKHFVLDDHAATGLYGGYTTLIYLTPMIGGIVADRYLGSKRSVRFGAVMMAAGYFALALSGPPSHAWLAFDGQHHAVEAVHFHDGPSTGSGAEDVLLAGHKLAITGHADGSIALSDAKGAIVRTLAPGTYRQGADRNPWSMGLLLVALSVIVVGNGFFKPNISTMVGALYEPGDARRDGGFTIFYMGINLGSILGQFLCPIFADWIGWWAGFLVAGVGMSIAYLLIRFDGGRLAGLGETPQRVLDKSGGDHAVLITLGAVLGVPLVWWLFTNVLQAADAPAQAGLVGYVMALPLMGKILLGTFLVGVPAILFWSWREGNKVEFQMMVSAMVLVTFNTVFWALFEQAGSSLTLFADRNTNRSVFGWFTLSAPQTQQFNSFAIVVLAPLMTILWAWLAKRGLEPSTPVKFAIALIGAGAGFLFLVLGAHFVGPDFRVALWWLFGLYVIQSVAELCISPVGLSMITKLSITRIVGLMMGVWFLSIAMGEYAAGALAQLASVPTVGGEVTNLKLSLDTYIGVFASVGWVAVAVGVLLLMVSPLLKRLMHSVH